MPSTSAIGPLESGEQAALTTTRRALASLILLLLALLSAIGGAKLVLPTIGRDAIAAGLPISIVGVAIALLVAATYDRSSARRAAPSHRGQFEHRFWFSDGMHRAGYSGYHNCFNLAASAAEAWARSRSDSASCADVPRRDAVSSARARYVTAGRCASGFARRFSFPSTHLAWQRTCDDPRTFKDRSEIQVPSSLMPKCSAT
jgi:hypothetical protein